MIGTIEVRTLGQDVVLVDGQMVHWPSRATRDLFAVLLLSPRGLTKFDLIERVWGDAALTEASGNFKVTLHRLRQALSNKSAVLEQHGRYMLAPPYYACSDHVEFQALIASAQGAPSRDVRLSLLHQAISLYKGDYLPDQLNDWAEETRIMLRTLQVQATLEVSRMHCGAVECHAAIRHLALALSSDPLVGEQYHQNLMTCLCTLRRSDEATRHYRHYLSFLQRELGDTPTSETARLAEQIRNAEVHTARQIGAASACPRRVLYGHPPPEPERAAPDLKALGSALQRGRQVLDVLTNMAGLETWTELAAATEQALVATLEAARTGGITAPDTGAQTGLRVALLRPAAALTGNALQLTDRFGTPWSQDMLRVADEALLDVQTAFSGRTLYRSLAAEGVTEVLVQAIGERHGPLTAWLLVVASPGTPSLSSAETELLDSVAQALTFTLSLPLWAQPETETSTPPGAPLSETQTG